MDIPNIIQILLILAIGGYIYYQFKLNQKLNNDNKENPTIVLREEIAELKSELKLEKSEKDQLAGKGKQLFIEITNLKNENKNLLEKNQELKDSLSKFRAEQKQKEAEFDLKITKLDEAKNLLEDEKKRIRKEDEDRQAKQIAERDRMWAEHEVKVISKLKDECAKAEYSFKTFDNNNLPETFNAKLKPDFMIEFLEEYLIFDAKSSKSDNLQIYISDQVKKTAVKLQKQSNIYKSIFFVVPTLAISELKKLSYFEQGYTFHVITPEAIESILASLKKIENYEFADQMNPQERENIVNLIAELDQHINFTNAAQLLLTQRGINSLARIKKIDTSLLDEVNQKKEKMRLEKFTPSDLKNFMMGTHIQQKAIREHVSPKAGVQESSIKQIEELIENEKISEK